MKEEIETVADTQSGQEVAKQISRFHVDHWKQRIYRKTYTRDGERHEVQEWSVRLQHDGRRESFALGTANAAVAASKARDIAVFLDANGWGPTIARFKPRSEPATKSCTVGEFLTDVAQHSHLKPATVRRYAVKLRKMVGDIAELETKLRSKERRQKYDHVAGGRIKWLTKVEAQPLSVLTQDSVTAWRNRYVARAGSNPVRRKSAERSAASYLRNARSLSSADVLGVLAVHVPGNPFAGVKLKDPGPQRYVSDIAPEWLLTVADRELRRAKGDTATREARRQQYLALFLCLWAGLRRKEADLLLWEQVDLAAGQIHIRRTKYFEPKTEESQRSIDLAREAMELLRAFKATTRSEFVLTGSAPNPGVDYDYYRCDCTWRDLNAWLHAKGVRQTKAVHALRKESGSLIASEYGIEAARQHLGHRDIRTTSAHYVTKKRRLEVCLALNPRSPTRLDILKMSWRNTCMLRRALLGPTLRQTDSTDIGT